MFIKLLSDGKCVVNWRAPSISNLNCREIVTRFKLFFSVSFHSKIVELEEELRVVGNNLKSLEVSEEKVKSCVTQVNETKTMFKEKNFRIFAKVSLYYFSKLYSWFSLFRLASSSFSKLKTCNYVGQPTRRRVQEPNQDPHYSSQGGSFESESDFQRCDLT